MLRFAAPVHIQLGHGESDKGSSISNQHKAYDLTFVGGAAGSDRLGAALRDFDAGARTVQIGRPQLDHDYPGAPDWSRGSGLRVWYAPTWEGDRASIAYGSLASHGLALVEALIADPRIRVIYRPHPRTGTASAAHAAADKAIRARLDGRRRTAPDRRGRLRLAVGFRRRVRHRHLRGRVRLARDRQAAGDHRAGRAQGLSAAVTDPGRDAAAAGERRRRDRSSWLTDRGLGADEGTRDPQLIALADYYFGDTADQASSAPIQRCHRPRARGGPASAAAAQSGRCYRPRRKSTSSSGAFGRSGCFLVPSDSAFGRPRKSQPTAPASGRQMTAVAHSQRGIRRTAYGWAWATSTTQ